ncbi:hypothetical protein QEN19_001217 [Hanseniaspora menglaensis]
MVFDSIHEVITSKDEDAIPTSLLALLSSSDKLGESNQNILKNQIDEFLNIQQNVFDNKAPIDALITEGLDVHQIFEQYNIILQVLSPKMLNDLKDLSSVLGSNDESDEEEDEIEEEDEEDEIEEAFEEEDQESFSGDLNEEIKDNESELLNENKSTTGDNSVEEEFHSALEDELDEGSISGEEEQNVSGSDKDVFFNAEELLNKLDEADENGIDILETKDDDEEIDFFADIPSEDEEEAEYFNDFFDAPKTNTTKRTGSKLQLKDGQFSDNEMDELMSNVRKDLFSDEEEEQEEKSEIDDADYKSNIVKPKVLSSHERQQLEIQKQIEQLESKSVEEKHWGMKGESSAKSRPKDSLVDADVELEFESNAKSVPVMTTEAIESIEEIIKRRIKNAEFDDLERRIINNTMKKRREREEVSQVKSKQSLAEQYKQDDKEGAAADEFEESDELKTKHSEIDLLFNDVMYTLNALSSAHFTPKPISKDLEVRVEASTITMEDQQPLIQNAESSLAPQEIYRNKGKDKLNENEVVLKNGLSISKEEMSKEEKQKMRRSIKRKRSKLLKEKEEKGTNKKSKIDESLDVLKSNSKHITVIGKDGKSTDSKGNTKSKSSVGQSDDSKFIGNYKL